MSAGARAEVIVVGLGAMGSATCRQLAQRGVSVLGFDRFHPPHQFGSTHGDTRITRLAIGEGPEYVPLVRRSHELWRELEAASGQPLLALTGGLVLARPGSDFFEDTLAVAERFGIEHERLTNAELRARYPMFAADERTDAYYEPTAGIVSPEAAVRAQLELARRDGAQLRLGEPVTDWSAGPGGVTVTTEHGTYAADQLVLCAGAWISDLFEAGREVFAVHRQLLYWFEIVHGYEPLRQMPIFVWDFGGDQPECVHLNGFYGFPAVDGPDGGVKVGTESYETMTSADGRQHPPTETEVAAIYRDYVQPRLPWLGPAPVRALSCLYTCTWDNRFVVDQHPEHDQVLIVSPCSGHGFKHSPAIGEAVAAWLTGGPESAAVDLTPFRLAGAHRPRPPAADARIDR